MVDNKVALLDNGLVGQLDSAKSSGGKASANAVMFNVITAGLGAGILSVPWTAAGASVFTAILILFGVLLVNYWTIMILIEGAEKYQVFDLGALLHKIPKVGPVADGYVNILIWVSSLMCLIGYLIIIGDNMSKILWGGPYDNRVIWVTVGSVVAFPLCFLEQDTLAFTSTFAIIVNIYLFGVVFYLGMFQPAEESPSLGPVCYLAFSKGGVSMFSALMMAMIIQMCVLPFYEELEDRSVPKFCLIMKKSFTFLFCLFSGFLFMSLLAFGEGVNSNVLVNLPDGLVGTLAQLGMGGVVLTVYPLMLMPMVAPVKTQFGKTASTVTTLGIVIVAMCIAYYATDLGLLVVVNGALSVSGFVSLAPALVGLYLVDANSTAMYALLILGALMTVLGMCLPLNYVAELKSSCLW